MKYNPEELKEKYDKIVDEEDKQEKKQSLRVEIPREFIKKYIKETDTVLDAGGGTGINAVMMAERAAHISLIDISAEIVERAKENIEIAGFSQKVDVQEGDISDLSHFKDEQFSFLVCVGDAISYVLENRFLAMQELVRVAQKNSILVIGCDSKYGFMRESLEDGDLDEAININQTHETYCGMGPRTYVYEIEEMKQLLEKNGCQVLEVASTPTLTDTVEKRQFYEPGKWEKLKELEMQLCLKPELLGVGNHLLFIAKKR